VARSFYHGLSQPIQSQYIVLRLIRQSQLKWSLALKGWARLESDALLWARYKGEIYVVTGVIFKKQRAHQLIGKNKIVVPDHFYKIVYSPNQDQSIDFVMPNARVKKNQVAKYRGYIADIESRTGMRFFIELPE